MTRNNWTLQIIVVTYAINYWTVYECTILFLPNFPLERSALLEEDVLLVIMFVETDQTINSSS